MLTARRRRALIVAMITAMFVFGSALHCSRGYYAASVRTGHAQGADDAYISYRYGWNLVHHGWLSWNESGYRRVEGFTNPLWVYLSAIPALSGRRAIVYPAMVVFSVFGSALLLFLLTNSVVRAARGSLTSAWGLAVAAVSPVLWLHSTSGLEGALFGFLIATLAFRTVTPDLCDPPRRVIVFGLVLLSVFLRSDGFVYLLPIVVSAGVLRSPLARSMAASVVVALVLLALWRWVEFHSFLPNTAVAKLNFGLFVRARVGARLLAGVLLASGIGLVGVLGVVGLALQRNWRLLIAAAFIEATWLAYYVYIGGDHFLERHLIGFLLFSAAGSGPLWVRLGPSSSTIVAIASVVFVLVPLASGDARFSYREARLPDSWVRLGQIVALRSRCVRHCGMRSRREDTFLRRWRLRRRHRPQRSRTGPSLFVVVLAWALVWKPGPSHRNCQKRVEAASVVLYVLSRPRWSTVACVGPWPNFCLGKQH